MLKWLSCVLTFCLAQANGEAFWKAKANVYERVQNGEIIVSVLVKKTAEQNPRYTLFMNGGGQVQAPRDFVFATVQKYEQLLASSDYIKDPHYNAAAERLDFDITALGYSAHLQMAVKPTGDPAAPQIDYRILAGPLTGFSGRTTFAAPAPRQCEIGITGEFKYDVFPLPNVFLEFGMEVVLKRIAEHLRKFAELQYALSQPKNKERK